MVSTKNILLFFLSSSGIHRSFGTHISYIKSTTLDDWTAEEVAHVQQIGNTKANAMYEAHIPASWPKPTSNTSMKYRKEFLTAKYVNKYFANTNTSIPGILPNCLIILCIAPEFANEVNSSSNKSAGQVAFIGLVTVLLKRGLNLVAADITGTFNVQLISLL